MIKFFNYFFRGEEKKKMKLADNGERFAKGICQPSKSQIKKMANYFPSKRMLALGFGGLN